MCLREIGLRAQKMLTILHLEANMVGEAYMTM